MAQELHGKGKSLHDALEDAAKNADRGDYQIVSIHVSVHHNNPGETGPNPIRDYSVVLGARGG